MINLAKIFFDILTSKMSALLMLIVLAPELSAQNYLIVMETEL